MRTNDFALVLVRSFGFVLAAFGIMSIAYVVVAFWLIATTPQDAVFQALKPYAWHYCLLAPLDILAGVLILLCAPRIARFVCKGSSEAA